jgi:hypothetical protein
MGLIPISNEKNKKVPLKYFNFKPVFKWVFSLLWTLFLFHDLTSKKNLKGTHFCSFESWICFLKHILKLLSVVLERNVQTM